MAVEPAGSLSLTLTNVRALIAGSAAWRKWTGKSTEKDAAASVYLVGLPLPHELDGGPDNAGYTAAQFAELRPFCLINFHHRDGAESDQVAQSAFVDTQRILFSFEDSVASEDAGHYQDAVLLFLNNAGAVLDELKGLAGTDDLVNVHKFRMEKAPTRAAETERATRGDYHVVIFSAEVGI